MWLPAPCEWDPLLFESDPPLSLLELLLLSEDLLSDFDDDELDESESDLESDLESDELDSLLPLAALDVAEPEPEP